MGCRNIVGKETSTLSGARKRLDCHDDQSYRRATGSKSNCHQGNEHEQPVAFGHQTATVVQPVEKNGLANQDRQAKQQGCLYLLPRVAPIIRSEEHTSELQSPKDLVCRLLLE